MTQNKKTYDQKHLIVFVPKNENLKFGVLSYLADTFEVYENRVTVLETSSEDEENGESRYAIVFRVNDDYNFASQFAVTVSERPFRFRCMQVHCKSKHRVFYTLNAMNELIYKETGSREDRSYQLDWSKYEERIIYLVRGELRMLSTKLIGVVNLSPIYDDVDNEQEETTRGDA